jgi:hypothetical protein
MKLFILKQLTGCDYDEYDAMVIRAESEPEARQIAGTHAGNEGSYCWQDHERTSCEELIANAAEAFVIGSYNAG